MGKVIPFRPKPDYKHLPQYIEHVPEDTNHLFYPFFEELLKLEGKVDPAILAKTKNILKHKIIALTNIKEKIENTSKGLERLELMLKYNDLLMDFEKDIVLNYNKKLYDLLDSLEYNENNYIEDLENIKENTKKYINYDILDTNEKQMELILFFVYHKKERDFVLHLITEDNFLRTYNLIFDFVEDKDELFWFVSKIYNQKSVKDIEKIVNFIKLNKLPNDAIDLLFLSNTTVEVFKKELLRRNLGINKELHLKMLIYFMDIFDIYVNTKNTIKSKFLYLRLKEMLLENYDLFFNKFYKSILVKKETEIAKKYNDLRNKLDIVFNNEKKEKTIESFINYFNEFSKEIINYKL